MPRLPWLTKHCTSCYIYSLYCILISVIDFHLASLFIVTVISKANPSHSNIRINIQLYGSVVAKQLPSLDILCQVLSACRQAMSNGSQLHSLSQLSSLHFTEVSVISTVIAYRILVHNRLHNSVITNL